MSHYLNLELFHIRRFLWVLQWDRIFSAHMLPWYFCLSSVNDTNARKLGAFILKDEIHFRGSACCLSSLPWQVSLSGSCATAALVWLTSNTTESLKVTCRTRGVQTRSQETLMWRQRPRVWPWDDSAAYLKKNLNDLYKLLFLSVAENILSIDSNVHAGEQTGVRLYDKK